MVADYQVLEEDSRELRVVAMCAFHSTGGSLAPSSYIIPDRSIPTAHSRSPRRILYSSLIGYVCSADIPKPLAMTLQLRFTLSAIKKKSRFMRSPCFSESLCAFVSFEF